MPDEPAALDHPISGEEYIELLLARQAAWMSRNPLRKTRLPSLPPLLEWFIREGDENFVRLPEKPTTPKRERTPRQYRSAVSLREERDRVQAQMDRITSDGCDDPASVNISPSARSRAAARAGRARFAKLDRDLERYTALRKRLDRLDFRIVTAEARELHVKIHGPTQETPHA